MQTLQIFLNIFTSSIFALFLSYYLVTNLQWYSYSFSRIIFKHHKKKWHFYFFIFPIFIFFLMQIYAYYTWCFYALCALFYLVYAPAFILWYKKLDKKLVWTSRIKRYFIFIIFFIILASINSYFLILKDSKITYYLVPLCYILSIFLGTFASFLCEFILFKVYTRNAVNKLKSMQDLKIIAITGSFGKTSMKNFIAMILSSKFNVYSTPRSVNTFKGLVDDINKNLNKNHQIYVAEAGARARGDIKEIAYLLNHHYAVIGKVGSAHIEYFRDIENTLRTKFELLDSKRLIKAYVQKDNNISKDYISKDFQENISKIITYPPEIKNIESNLDETKFSMKIDSKWIDFKTNILGKFNIDNIAAALLLANDLGIDSKLLQKAVANLKPIEHRLQRIDANGKIILDDSFNGNLEGMSEAVRLASLHNGRKVIITPGLVECDDISNIELSKKIDDVFDLVIITGSLNTQILDNNIKKAQKILLKDKANMESILANNLKSGDLILFANDAPSYI